MARDTLPFRDQHKARLSWMPYLYFSLHPRHRAWAVPWQQQLQAHFATLETVTFGSDCFVAPSAHLFAEPGRAIVVGDRSSIGAEVFMHGPVVIGSDVSINPRCCLDGRAAGIRIGNGTRIAPNVQMYAFDHGLDPARPVREQPVTSRGIVVGADVWIGAQVCITDGVTIGDHAVVAMGSVVTGDVADWQMVGGVPARVIGDRREKRSNVAADERDVATTIPSKRALKKQQKAGKP